MHRFIFTIATVFIFGIFFNLSAQKDGLPPGYENLPKLSLEDSIGLVSLPEMKMPDWLKGTNTDVLPYEVDNSEQIYWRPVFEQSQFECGQASGVGLGFTYAINRMRDLPSDEEENQYPTHFTWNYGNGGNGWYGVSYFHSFEIIKKEGNPNVVDFGGMTGTGPEMWMDGYDKYYNAMHNRVADVYKIDLTTEEGINTLRHWIHNHLDGSDVGGVANFYTNAPYSMSTLPSGTPEAGKYVVTSWSSANHGLTIAGYHDSICWDYNNDGQYTNDIDLNGDGEITPRDWEIGGLRFANTYSGGPSFGNNGFSYMTYKSCADSYGAGGIWDNAAHIVYAKANTEPLLTAKIELKYNCRNRLRVQIGVSTDVEAESPDYVLGFPIFNYQGGCQYMQGGNSSEDNKFIEFGLDITPLLNLIGNGTPARYFLLLNENDPDGWAWGEMINFSLMDYTNGVEEIICDEANVGIANNDLTTFWVDHEVSFDPVEIITEEMPPATVYEPYSGQLEASGGAAPYVWCYDMNFTETESSGTYPTTDAQQLSPNSSSNGYALKTLEFAFPFYNSEFNQVRVNVDGYISFENAASWPYQVYDFFNYTRNKLISPFQADLRLYSSNSDGIWYEGDENSATFRWKASVEGYQTTSELNFAVQLFKNGDIQFHYGEINDYPDMEWISGLSAGDNILYQFMEISNNATIPANHTINLEATRTPEGFSVSRSGELMGTATQVYEGFDIKFLVTDENNITDSKVVSFSTDGSNYLIIKDVIVSSGDDDVIGFGETAHLSVEIESLGVETIYNAEMVLSNFDEYITLIDSTENLGDFEPGEIKTFELAYTLEVGNSVPNAYELSFPTLITDDSNEEWASHIYLMAYAPNIKVNNTYIDDASSGGLDPGETADLVVVVKNTGGAKATDIQGILSSADPYITINSNTGDLLMLNAGATGSLVFNVTASEDTPAAYIFEFIVDIQADNDYITSDLAYIVCGLLMEGYESGNFEAYPWSFSGNNDWVIDEVQHYEGQYSARSGVISDDQTSVMQLEVFVLNAGEISFYKMVSSESNYDYLRFYIDGAIKDSWDGESPWTEETYTVSAGFHTLKWAYEKDYSVSNGSDCGWIDNITLPPVGDQNPQILFAPSNFSITINENITVQDTISINNVGGGPVVYTIETADSLGNLVDWINVQNANGGLNPGNIDKTAVIFDGTDMEDGLYEASIIITDHIGNIYPIEVELTVDLISGIVENESSAQVKVLPNPFSGNTTLQFTLKEDSPVSVMIYNAQGEMIKSLIENQRLKAGTHKLSWDATSNNGSRVTNGVFYYRIIIEETIGTGKLILLD